jgi:O-succinylbenzoate synthase
MVLSKVKGHRMAKAALEMAILDGDLRTKGVAFSEYLGGIRGKVEVGVSVGIQSDVDILVDRVQRYVAEGYRRVKLKIEPGWDVEPVRAVRQALGENIALQVDANTAYSVADIRRLTRLDEYNLLLIEQPFGARDLWAHEELAKQCRTPICLDESIESSADAHHAIVAGACRIVNVKAGRVGGYLEARRVHDVCLAAGVPVWCGGMLETGIGRAANLALASLPNFALPGDISASNRYYTEDLTDPFLLEESTITVPTGPGLGVEVRSDELVRHRAVRTLVQGKTVFANPA